MRLDTGFHSHPKVLAVGNTGAGLYARALSYCGDHLTDGFVPFAWVRVAGTARLAERLCGAGLWNEVEGGYMIRDYLAVGNPSRVQVDSARKADRLRKQSARNPAGIHGESARIPNVDVDVDKERALGSTVVQHEGFKIPGELLRDMP